jgi:hypothetical protein
MNSWDNISRDSPTQMPYTCLRRHYTKLGRIHVDELNKPLKVCQCNLDMYVKSYRIR